MDKTFPMTEKEHQELMIWLEAFLSIAMSKVWGHDRFMFYPYLKLVNDTFSELLVNDAIEAGI